MVYRCYFEEKNSQLLENLAIFKLSSTDYILIKNRQRKPMENEADDFLRNGAPSSHNGNVHCLHKQFSTLRWVYDLYLYR